MKLIDEVANAGLKLSMEFGEQWLEPIHNRLAARYPTLTDRVLERYDKLCKKINKTGHAYVRKNPVKVEGRVELMSMAVFEAFMVQQYPWINDDNLGQLYSQSCYYALK